MRKKFFILIIVSIVLLFLGCNEDGLGVLQSVHNATKEEGTYNQMFLGVDTDDTGTYIYLVRNWDVYRVQSVEKSSGKYKLVYTKLVELSTHKNNLVPIAYNDGYLYFGRLDDDDSAYSFYYVSVDDCLEADIGVNDITETVSFGDYDEILEFSASRLSMDEVQFLFLIENDDGDEVRVFASTDPENLTTSGISLDYTLEGVPTNAGIIGHWALRVRTDDPELDGLKDELNELYLVSEGDDGLELLHIYNKLSYKYFAFGFDGFGDTNYAAFFNGYIYEVSYETTKSGYDGQLGSKKISFDTYKRQNNVIAFYEDDDGNVIGYLSKNGVYWRSGGGTPVLRTVSDDSNIVPIMFLAAGTNENGDPEYLLLTQDNGFFIVEPYYHKKTSRAYITKIDNSSSTYNLADYFSED